MSTPAIVKAEKEGLLKRFQPLLDPDEKDDREIWMPPSLHEWLYQSDRNRSRDYKANIRALLKKFVINDAYDPIDNEDYLKPIRGKYWPHIFALRYQLSCMHRDATRIFGAFAGQDCLVLFYCRLRHELEARPELWERACDKVDDKWRECLGPAQMLRGQPFGNCVSGNFDDRG